MHQRSVGGASLGAAAGDSITLEFLYFSRGADRGEGAEYDTCVVSLQEKSRSSKRSASFVGPRHLGAGDEKSRRP
jgi:hypothetical protein